LAAHHGDTLSIVQDKTGEFLKIPFYPKLAAAIAIMPRPNSTFLLTEAGAPFSAEGFGNWFRDRCAAVDDFGMIAAGRR
jgi:hypothetical protein